MKHITPAELAAWLADAQRAQPQLLDVREPWEFETCSIAGSRHIPMGEIPGRYGEVDAQTDLVVICHHGGRSLQVAAFLEKNGYARVHNLSGGVHAWAQSVDPAMPVY
ncbi:MAG TPA: rhodanese-like domain-containing protein [Burkholderiales bacterium]|nr:rhodanese-like domain-containing protein [Burkholderiales bacterium]